MNLYLARRDSSLVKCWFVTKIQSWLVGSTLYGVFRTIVDTVACSQRDEVSYFDGK